MKARVDLELTTEEMAAAEMLLDRTQSEVAARLGMNERTLRRRTNEPAFMAYQQQLREQRAKEKQVEARKIARKIMFTKADAVELLVKIAQCPGIESGENMAGRVKALDLLARMMGWIPKEPLPLDPQTEVEGPDVYEAEWMKQRPQ